MTDIVERPALLPSESGAYPVRDTLADVDGRLDDIDVASIFDVKDVDAAPVGLLPYLAWEAAVDVWRATWSDETKRAVIKASPIVKRHKGTRYAVRTAVAALKVEAVFEEWWEVTPKRTPYTFMITTFVNSRGVDLKGPLITPELTKDLFDSVNAAKPISRAFTFRVGAKLTSNQGLGTYGRALQISKDSLFAEPLTDFGAGIAARAAGRILQLGEATAFAEPLTDLSSNLGLAAPLGRAILFVSARMEATP